MLKELYDPEDFVDGIPLPNGTDVNFNEDDSDDGKDIDANSSEEASQSDVSSDSGVEEHSFSIVNAVFLFFTILGLVALVITLKKKGFTWVWNDVKDRIYQALTDAIDSAVARTSVYLRDAIQHLRRNQNLIHFENPV